MNGAPTNKKYLPISSNDSVNTPFFISIMIIKNINTKRLPNLENTFTSLLLPIPKSTHHPKNKKPHEKSICYLNRIIFASSQQLLSPKGPRCFVIGLEKRIKCCVKGVHRIITTPL